MPRVSVVVTAWNCAPFVGPAIDSVRAQSVTDLEILVVDDGSTDDTREVVRARAADDPRVRLLTQPHAGCPAIARNHAITHARGEFLSFLDGDDLHHPERLERLLRFAEAEPGIGAFFHDHVRFRECVDESEAEGYLHRLHWKERAARFLEPLGGTRYRCRRDIHVFFALEVVGMHTSAVFLRRGLLGMLAPGPFRTDVIVGEDTDLWLRLARGARLGYLDEPLSYYRQHAGGVTARRHQVARDSVIIRRDDFDRARPLLTAAQQRRYRRKLAESWFSLGWSSVQEGQAGEARRAYLHALALDPRPSTLVALAKTWVPQPIARRLRARRSVIAGLEG